MWCPPRTRWPLYPTADPAQTPSTLGASWLIVTEGVSATEPLGGDTGKLLDNMLRAMQLHRHPRVFLAALARPAPGARPDDDAPTDWRDARNVPLEAGKFDLDDYIDYVADFCRYLGPNVHVIAVCQPSVPVMGAAALMAEAKEPRQPKPSTLMGGPIDTRVSPTVPNDLAMRNSMMWFRQNVISTVPLNYPGALRRVYPGFLQLTSFISMNLDRHVNAHMRQFEHLVKGDDDPADAHRTFYDEYLAVMDLSAEFYLQTIEVVFKEHLLPRGEWVSRGRKIDPSFIETALMTVEGELDDISGVGQTKAAHALTPNIPGARHVHWEQPRV
eukprot:gene1233-1630_t